MRKPRSGTAVVWVIVGVIVAAGHHFFDSLSTLSGFLSAVLAVAIWPLVIFHIHVGI